MNVKQLIEILEDLDPDAEVLLMSQQSWPFENGIAGVAVREDLVEDDEDLDDEEREEPRYEKGTDSSTKCRTRPSAVSTEAAMNGLPEHTSSSQLALYATCPRKYRYRYIEKAQAEYQSVALALGSAVHSAIGWWFDQQRAGAQPTITEAEAIVRADLTATTGDTTRYGKWTHDDLQTQAERLVRCFLETNAELPVKESEARFDLELHDPDTGEVLPRKLLGFLDFVLTDRRVVELKTARSEYTALDIAKNIQFGAYRLALRELDIGEQLRVIVILKRRQPRLQQIELRPDLRAERFFLETASGIERAILAGHFPPAPGMSCGYCEYQTRCLGVVEAHADVQ